MILWPALNKLVNEKIKKQLKILKKRKRHNQGYDLFTIANTLLKSLNKKTLEKRKCSNCKRPRFHLIKFICCDNFFCLTCFTINRYEMKNFNCTFCTKAFIRNTDDFIETLISLTLTVWRTMCVVDEEKENGLENAIIEALEMQDNSKPLNINGIMKYANPEVNINWIDGIPNEKLYFEQWIPRSKTCAQLFNIFAICIPQYLLFGSLDKMNILWIGFNFYVVKNLILKNKYFTYNDDVNPNIQIYITTDLHEKIDIILKGFVTMIVTWINIIIGLYLGNHWHEGGLVNIAFFTTPIIWVMHLKIRKKIQSNTKGRPVTITDVCNADNPPPIKRIIAIIPRVSAQTTLVIIAGSLCLEST
jgi:hypothetical protein